MSLHCVPCMVSSEWAATVSNLLGTLQASTISAQLWQELALLEQIMYKNTNQHRGTRPFQKLYQVRRLGRLAKSADIDSTITSLKDLLLLASKPTLTLHERKVPTEQSVDTCIAQKLLGYCNILQELATVCLPAASQFTTQLAQSYFMPLSLTCLAIVARMRALSSQLLMDSIRNYNAVMEIRNALPKITRFDAHKEHNQHSFSLPFLLQCSWTEGNTPKLILVTSSTTDQEERSSLTKRPTLVVSTSTITGTTKQDLTNQDQSSHNAKQQGEAMNDGVMALVVEDRGVPLSRDELMAELRSGQQAHDTDSAAQNHAFNDIVVEKAAPVYARHNAVFVLDEDKGDTHGAPSKNNREKKRSDKKKSKTKIRIVDDDVVDAGGFGDPRNKGRTEKGQDQANMSSSRKQLYLQQKQLELATQSQFEKKDEKKNWFTFQSSASQKTTAFIRVQEPAKKESDNQIKSWEEWLLPSIPPAPSTGLRSSSIAPSLPSLSLTNKNKKKRKK